MTRVGTFLSAFLVSLAIGAAIGFAAAYVPDVIENAEDGFDWNDLNTFENNWEKYIVSTLNGLVTGAVQGLEFLRSIWAQKLPHQLLY